MTTNQRHFPIEQVSEDRLRQAIQIMTTEHFTLQTGRGATIAEANGRLSAFLTTTSSALIAIAFIGQSSDMGIPFRVFTLLLLPALLFLGIATLGRVIQSAGEDGMYLTEINRIRHFYVEVVPEIGDYFVLSTHDDWRGRLASSGITWSNWQPLFSIPGMVSVINGIIAGTLAGLLAAWIIDWSLLPATVLGLITAVVVVATELRYGLNLIKRNQRRAPLFPSPLRDAGRPSK